MSENLDLVRSIFAAWERGDFSSADWADREIEFASPQGVEPVSVQATSDMSHQWGQTMSAWQDVRTHAEEYTELDCERVFVSYRFSGHGKLSGIEVDSAWTRGAALFHVREGRVVRLTIYVDRDRALGEVGLEE